jgi:hypothetical protein
VNLILSIIFSLSGINVHGIISTKPEVNIDIKKQLNMRLRMFHHYPYYCNALPMSRFIGACGFGEAKKVLGYAEGGK